jgi:histone H3
MPKNPTLVKKAKKVAATEKKMVAKGKAKAAATKKKVAAKKTAVAKPKPKIVKKKPAVAVKKEHRFKSGTVALRNIKKQQKSIDLALRRAPFRRVIKRLMSDVYSQLQAGLPEYHFSASAILSIQQSAEAYGIRLFKNAGQLALNARRVTVQDKDIQLARLNMGVVIDVAQEKRLATL